MMEITGDDGAVYKIEAVPLDEAKILKASGIEFYDNTRLVAVNTCPTFGVLRYAKHRTESAIGGRNLALECGSACHDFFAAIRMWTLLNTPRETDHDTDIIIKHGLKLFGEERWQDMMKQPQDGGRDDNAIRFALSALHTSGYYDDPSDRRRTLANMEVACITYAHRYFQSDLPVFVAGDFVGVEVPFVTKISCHRSDGLYPSGLTAYYCGRIDGVHHYGSNQLISGENKTAGRINDVWRMQFHMSSQVTGYNLALSTLLGAPVVRSIIMGTQIPVPVRDIYSGVSFEEVNRADSDFVRWLEWFFHSVQMYEMWRHDPTRAPRYTHSCNRYFSICQFLPFCTAPRSEQQSMIDAMRVEEWSPLDHAQTIATEE